MIKLGKKLIAAHQQPEEKLAMKVSLIIINHDYKFKRHTFRKTP